MDKLVAFRAYEALTGELMDDGCVRGCPRRKSPDNSHNLRCTNVANAIKDLRKELGR